MMEKSQFATQNSSGTESLNVQMPYSSIITGKDDEQKTFKIPSPNEKTKAIRTNPTYTCFLCTSILDSTQKLESHFSSHPEQWTNCPICQNDRNAKGEEKFTNLASFYQHLKASHIKIDKMGIQCTQCDYMQNPSEKNGSINKTIGTVIRHIIYDCVGQGLCMICGDFSVNSDDKNIVSDKLENHRYVHHRLIYDRFICTSCRNGFYSRELFHKHKCQVAYRCSCKPSLRFRTLKEFNRQHYQKLSDIWSLHELLPSKVDDDVSKRKFEINSEYENIVNARFTNQTDTGTQASNRYGPPPLNSRPSRSTANQVFSTKVVRNEKQVQKSENTVSNTDTAPSTFITTSSIKIEFKEEEENTSKEVDKTNPKPNPIVKKTRKLTEHLQLRPIPVKVEKYTTLPKRLQTYLCRACCLAFHLKTEHARHMVTQHNPTVYACRKCSMVSSSEFAFLEHKNSHEAQLYTCTICSVFYTGENLLLYHMSKEHDMTLAFFCKTCSLCSTDIGAIVKHINNRECIVDKHPSEFVGVCDAAQLRFVPASFFIYSRMLNHPDFELVQSSTCRHKYLVIPNPPEHAMTCIDCNCPIPLSIWKSTCRNPDLEKFSLASDDGPHQAYEVLFWIANLEEAKARKVQQKQTKRENALISSPGGTAFSAPTQSGTDFNFTDSATTQLDNVGLGGSPSMSESIEPFSSPSKLPQQKRVIMLPINKRRYSTQLMREIRSIQANRKRRSDFGVKRGKRIKKEEPIDDDTSPPQNLNEFQHSVSHP